MSELIVSRVAQAKASTAEEEKQVLREMIQEICLLGLWRAKFSEKGAFYGGTALRILHGLDRFSEDLDFTLLQKDREFDPMKYYKAIQTELEGFGFEVTLDSKKKKLESPIQSAFVKTDTHVSFLLASSRFSAHPGSLIRVKLEIDTEAVSGFATEVHQSFWPQAFSVLACDLPSLMAGKLHAAFCRGIRKNVKGRDWYDLLWYTARGLQPNWFYLENKLRSSDHWHGEFSPALFKKWALERIATLNVEAARADISRFIANPERIDGWSRDVFVAAINRLT